MEVSVAIINQIKKKKKERNSQQEGTESITQEKLEPLLRT
jgi:hypothetical protein